MVHLLLIVNPSPSQFLRSPGLVSHTLFLLCLNNMTLRHGRRLDRAGTGYWRQDNEEVRGKRSKQRHNH